MNKLIAVGIIIALSVNATIMVLGFGYLHNEINQLKNQEPDLPATPTPTEPEPTPEPEPELTPKPEPEATPEPEPVQEPAPQEVTEPENSELKHEMMAPEVNITAEGINDKQTYDHLDINFQGTIVNPNSRPIYNVSITLEFHLTLVQMIYPTPNPYHNPTRTITLERMFGNQVVQINESFEEKYTHTGYYTLNYFTYTVNWNETK